MESAETGLIAIDGGKSVEVGERATILAGSKQWAAKVRKRAKELSETLDMGYMELARILYQVYDTPVEGDPQRGAIFTSWGYESFSEYAEKELGLHKKKAERLRLIWYTLEVQLKDMPIAIKDRIANLGYSKVRELVRVVTLRNADIWLEQAENSTYRQLYQAICDEKKRQTVEEDLLGPGGGASERDDIVAGSEDSSLSNLGEDTRDVFKQKRFDLAAPQMDNVSLALKKCSELSGSEKEGHLLDLICTDFLATNDVMGGDIDKRLRYLAKIERVLSVKIIAVDPGSKDVIYGVGTLEMLASE